MTKLLPHLEVETSSNPTASVIWLHGIGADGHDFQPIVAELGLPKTAAIRFIFPHAPSIPVTINAGFVMPAWYDILEMSIEREVDQVQLKKSANAIVDFIENEISRGIASERIIIAGFSQGGAVAIETALSYQHQLAGLLLMSTYFATKDSIVLSEENKSLPIEIQHGQFDAVVPISLSQTSAQFLIQHDYPVKVKTYPMEHSVCPQQIQDISDWIVKCLQLG